MLTPISRDRITSGASAGHRRSGRRRDGMTLRFADPPLGEFDDVAVSEDVGDGLVVVTVEDDAVCGAAENETFRVATQLLRDEEDGLRSKHSRGHRNAPVADGKVELGRHVGVLPETAGPQPNTRFLRGPPARAKRPSRPIMT